MYHHPLVVENRQQSSETSFPNENLVFLVFAKLAKTQFFQTNMKYNCELSNNDALPIPYVRKVGDNLVVGDLSNDRPMFLNLLFVTATKVGQFELRCEDQTIIIQPYPSLTIKHVDEPKTDA